MLIGIQRSPARKQSRFSLAFMRGAASASKLYAVALAALRGVGGEMRHTTRPRVTTVTRVHVLILPYSHSRRSGEGGMRGNKGETSLVTANKLWLVLVGCWFVVACARVPVLLRRSKRQPKHDTEHTERYACAFYRLRYTPKIRSTR